MRTGIGYSLFLATCVLVGCGGRLVAPPTGSQHDAMASGEQRTAATTAKLTFTIPTVAPSGAPIVWTSKPSMLSPSTASVAGTVAGHAFGPIAVSPTTPGCASSNNGWQCTLTVQAPVGQQESLIYRTFASSNGSGSPLAVSTAVSVNVYANQTNVAPQTTASGIPVSIHIAPSSRTVTQGIWASISLLAYARDASGQVIPSTHTVSPLDQTKPFTVTLAASGPVNRTTTVLCCGLLAPYYNGYQYTGIGTQTEKFTVRAPGVTGSASSVTVSPGYVGTAPLLSTGYRPREPIFTTLLEFPSNASGNVSPARNMVLQMRSLVFQGYDLLSTGQNGDVWIGSNRYSNSGTLLGSVTLSSSVAVTAVDSGGHLWAQAVTNPCKFFQYPPGFGQPAPIREIDYASKTDKNVYCGDADGELPSVPITVDEQGNLFVAPDAPNRDCGVERFPQFIIEFSAASGSGYVTPVRTVRLPGRACEVYQLDTDAAGNLYASSTGMLYEFAPGATTPTQPLGNLPVTYFAVDEGGDIYASIYAGQGMSSIYFYPAGSSTPSQTFGGPLTQLQGGPIAVPRTGH